MQARFVDKFWEARFDINLSDPEGVAGDVEHFLLRNTEVCCE